MELEYEHSFTFPTNEHMYMPYHIDPDYPGCYDADLQRVCRYIAEEPLDPLTYPHAAIGQDPQPANQPIAITYTTMHRIERKRRRESPTEHVERDMLIHWALIDQPQLSVEQVDDDTIQL